MSGRSAYVRKQNIEQAEKRAYKEYPDYAQDEPYLYGYPGAPTTPSFSANPSHTSSRPRRRSASSTSSTYGHALPHMPSHIRKPRPIIVASAIEKSDFRTHLDGMSSTLRGKIGGLIKGKKEPTENSRQRPGAFTLNSDFATRSDNHTPSLDAVPSLTASTSPSEIQVPFSSAGNRPPAPRQRQQQESVIHKIRRFEGGGKLPQLGWKSLSNVRSDKPCSLIYALTRFRILNFGMRLGTRLCTCTCAVHGQSRPLLSGSIPESSSGPGLRNS